jgi:hypothetical protein
MALNESFLKLESIKTRSVVSRYDVPYTDLFCLFVSGNCCVTAFGIGTLGPSTFGLGWYVLHGHKVTKVGFFPYDIILYSTGSHCTCFSNLAWSCDRIAYNDYNSILLRIISRIFYCVSERIDVSWMGNGEYAGRRTSFLQSQQ